MTIGTEQQQIEQFLTEKGLAEVVPTLIFVQNRAHSRLWRATLLTAAGDAGLDIIVYPLTAHPELVVDFEEEKTALTIDPSQEEYTVTHASELIAEGRTPDLGILLAALVVEAGAIRYYLDAQHRSDVSTPQTNLTYHPQLDRIFGGDFTRVMNGYYVKSHLLSMQRAQNLYQTLLELKEAYLTDYPAPTKEERVPFPVPLVVLELETYPVQISGQTCEVPIPELFSLGSLVKTPEAYHHFCQMHTIVPDDRNMLRNRLPPGTAQQAFAGQLFRIIRCGHRCLGATFHRNGNSNLTLACVTPTGALLDLYFLTSSQEIGSVQVLRECKQNDLLSAFEMLCTLAYEVSQTLVEMLLEALTTYAYPAAVPEDLKMLAKETAVAIIQAQARPYDRSSSPLKALVDVTLALYPPLRDTGP